MGFYYSQVNNIKEVIMDVKDLEQKWNEMLKGVFESFVDSDIGRDAKKRPVCFGTGDGHT